jgi:hypothetical protein
MKEQDWGLDPDVGYGEGISDEWPTVVSSTELV